MAIKQTKREIKSAETEKRIRDASADLFRRYGFDRVTIEDICDASQVSKGTFYLHFSSKQDLLIAAETILRDAYTDQHFVFDESLPFKELFRRFYTVHFAFNLQSSKDHNRNAYLSYIRIHKIAYNPELHYHRDLKRIIELGISRNAFRAALPFSELWLLIHHTLIGFLIGWSVDDNSLPDSTEQYNRILDALVDALIK